MLQNLKLLSNNKSMLRLLIPTIVLTALLIGIILSIKCQECKSSHEGMKMKPKKKPKPSVKRNLLPRVDVVLMVVTSNDPSDIVLRVIKGWKKIGIKTKVYLIGDIIPNEFKGKVELFPSINGIPDDISAGVMRLLLPGIQSGAKNVMVSSGTMFPVPSSYWSKTGGHDSGSFVVMRNKIGDQHPVLWNCASPAVWRELMGLSDSSKQGVLEKILSWNENGEWQDGYDQALNEPLNVHGIDEALLNHHLKKFGRSSVVYVNSKDTVFMSSLTSDNNFLVSAISNKMADKIVVVHDEFKYYDIVVLTPDNDLYRSADYDKIMTDLLNGWITSKAMYKHSKKVMTPAARNPIKLAVDTKIKPNSFR